MSALGLLPDHPPVRGRGYIAARGVDPGPAGAVTLDPLLGVVDLEAAPATAPLGGRSIHLLKLGLIKTGIGI